MKLSRKLRRPALLVAIGTITANRKFAALQPSKRGGVRSTNRKPALILLAVSAALGAFAPAAIADTTPTDAITMNWLAPYVSSAPWNGSGESGTFLASGASINDGGSFSVAFHVGAAVSQTGSTETLSSERTLTGLIGTVTLKCDEIGHNVGTVNLVSVAGRCTVITGTGAYRGLHGQGEITGTADFSEATAAALSEVLELRT
jgi:hypothetical protein